VLCSNKVARKPAGSKALPQCSLNLIDWFWKSGSLLSHKSSLCQVTMIVLLPVRYQNDLKVPRKLGDVTNISSRFFFFWFWIHTASAPITSGTHLNGGAVTRKPGWLEGTPELDLGLQGTRTIIERNPPWWLHTTFWHPTLHTPACPAPRLEYRVWDCTYDNNHTLQHNTQDFLTLYFETWFVCSEIKL